jgi:hypothetical protein
MRVIRRNWRSVISRAPFSTFSAIVTEGASRVPLAVLMMTDRSAP